MRVATLFDIHASMTALDAVLQEAAAERVDGYVVGGDVVCGAQPAATLKRLLALEPEPLFIRGNTERAVASRHPDDVRAWVHWVRAHLSDADLAFLGRLPRAASLPGLECLFCHATPRSDREIVTPASDHQRLLEAFAGVRQRLVVCGHTHIQFSMQVDDILVVNPGSVGMPIGTSAALWALVGKTVEFRRTPYDLDQACGAIRASGHPDAEPMMAELLHPFAVEESISYFERRQADDPRRGMEDATCTMPSAMTRLGTKP